MTRKKFLKSMRLARLLENCAIYGLVINCVYISGNVLSTKVLIIQLVSFPDLGRGKVDLLIHSTSSNHGLLLWILLKWLVASLAPMIKGISVTVFTDI